MKPPPHVTAPVLPPSPKRAWPLGWGKLALLAGAIVLVVALWALPWGARRYALQPFKVSTGGMAPTLLGHRPGADGRQIPGDHILVEKVSYRFHPPRRGDIVVFRTDSIAAIPPESRGSVFVQRVVGLPGERVSIQPPHVLINGEKLLEPPVFQRIADRTNGFPGYSLARPPKGWLTSAGDEIQVPAGEYFLLGDNSPNSFDSRYWGTVPADDIVGRMLTIYWPRERSGTPE